jgi:type I restriction enzyme S subunit
MKKDFIEDSIDHVSHVAVGESNLKLVEPGSVLLVVRGMILAHSVPVALTAVPLTINQDMKALVVKSPEMSGRYVWAALRIAKPLLRSLVRTAAHGTRKLDTPELLQVQLPTPDPVQLSACHSAVEAHRQMQQSVAASGEKIETLFSILLHRAFSGDLTASWREAHMKELLQEMEQQARLLGGSSAEVNT